MPRIKQTATQENQSKARSVISKYMDLRMVSEEAVATHLQISKRSYQTRRKKPEMFSLGELWRLCKYLRIDDEDKKIILGG